MVMAPEQRKAARDYISIKRLSHEFAKQYKQNIEKYTETCNTWTVDTKAIESVMKRQDEKKTQFLADALDTIDALESENRELKDRLNSLKTAYNSLWAAVDSMDDETSSTIANNVLLGIIDSVCAITPQQMSKE